MDIEIENANKMISNIMKKWNDSLFSFDLFSAVDDRREMEYLVNRLKGQEVCYKHTKEVAEKQIAFIQRQINQYLGIKE